LIMSTNSSRQPENLKEDTLWYQFHFCSNYYNLITIRKSEL
jgi:hypothetical protein